MYVHIPIHGNRVESTGEYMFDAGMLGRIFFFPGIKAAVGIMKKDPYSSFCFLKIIYFGCTESSCCSWAFSSCGDRGYSLAVVLGLLIVVASLVAEH